MGGQGGSLTLRRKGGSDMEVRERKRLEQVMYEVEDDIKHLTANIATLKARRYEKRKLIEDIKEMIR